MGPHATFIIAAYLFTGFVVAVLIAWEIVDYRAQTRALEKLERRGMRRRADRG
jgi:heme exporter protein D